MAELSGLQIFKYLPAAKRLPEGNCKKCNYPTCMAFALKLAKGQADAESCPFVSDELKDLLVQYLKKPQKEVLLGAGKSKVLIGGENVLFRHDKTFINRTAIGVVIDSEQVGWEEKLKRVLDFEIIRIKELFKVDFIYLKGNFSPELTQKLDESGFVWGRENDLSEISQVEDEGVCATMKKLTEIRKKAVLEKDENFSNPVMVYLKQESNIYESMSKAGFYLCKYANLLLFEDFNEALFSTLMTLRQNIYTDPQKPMQVESKVYEFNNADENSLIFLTTNFALTYFAVANEIEAMDRPAYLVVTPSDGMSVLTAWSAEKFTSQIAAKTIEKFGLAEKVKNKKIIIPGLLAHMKEELEEAIPDFEILVGPNEAYMLNDFVKTLA